MKVNLNADLGERGGGPPSGQEAALLELVGSASIACGFHAGDPDTMRATVRAARERGVSIGAHPSFLDREGFGRRPQSLAPAQVENLVLYQLGALQAIAAAEGHPVTHVKAHGALNNLAAADPALAGALASAIAQVDPSLVYVAVAGSAMEAAGEAAGLAVAREAFADRSYEDDGSLTPRSHPDALVHDPEAAAARVLRMVTEGVILTRTGRGLARRVDTVCLHGDSPGALAMARAIRAALEAAGVALLPLPELLAR